MTTGQEESRLPFYTLVHVEKKIGSRLPRLQAVRQDPVENAASVQKEPPKELADLFLHIEEALQGMQQEKKEQHRLIRSLEEKESMLRRDRSRLQAERDRYHRKWDASRKMTGHLHQENKRVRRLLQEHIRGMQAGLLAEQKALERSNGIGRQYQLTAEAETVKNEGLESGMTLLRLETESQNMCHRAEELEERWEEAMKEQKSWWKQLRMLMDPETWEAAQERMEKLGEDVKRLQADTEEWHKKIDELQKKLYDNKEKEAELRELLQEGTGIIRELQQNDQPAHEKKEWEQLKKENERLRAERSQKEKNVDPTLQETLKKQEKENRMLQKKTAEQEKMLQALRQKKDRSRQPAPSEQPAPQEEQAYRVPMSSTSRSTVFNPYKYADHAKRGG
ncbi:hypothetical protein [Salibacterium sp. K-3]